MKKKILFLINSLDYSGGTEKQIFQLLAKLPANKYDLHLFVCKYNDRVKNLKKKGIKIHLIGNFKIYNFFTYFKILKILKQIKPNIVLTYFYKMEFLIFMVKVFKIIDFNWIMNERTSPLHSDSYIKKMANFFKLSNIIISNSWHGKKYWDKYFKSSLLVNNGHKKTNLSVKKKKSKNLRLIFLSRNVSSKNGEFFLKLTQHLDDKYILTFVSSKFNQIQKKFKNLRLKRFCKSINSLYKNQDLLIFPSEFEGSPNVIYECFMRKILVLCLRKNYSELFFKKKLCLEINNKNPYDLSLKLKKIKNRYLEGKYNSTLDKAYNFAKKFSVDNQVNKYQKIFDKI
jgi:hypothetical protein